MRKDRDRPGGIGHRRCAPGSRSHQYAVPTAEPVGSALTASGAPTGGALSATVATEIGGPRQFLGGGPPDQEIDDGAVRWILNQLLPDEKAAGGSAA